MKNIMKAIVKEKKGVDNLSFKEVPYTWRLMMMKY